MLVNTQHAACLLILSKKKTRVQKRRNGENLVVWGDLGACCCVSEHTRHEVFPLQFPVCYDTT